MVMLTCNSILILHLIYFFISFHISTLSDRMADSEELITDSLLGAESRKIVLDTFSKYDHDKIGISFNGGKDSVAMVEFTRRTVGEDTFRECFVFVIDEDDEFDELICFRDQYIRDHFDGVRVVRVQAPDIRSGTWALTKQLRLDAALMGTRKSDPHGAYQKSATEPTTNGWPSMLRVCPIFYWSAADVWRYIHQEKLLYCELYEKGYTSLGKKSRTAPNDSLRDENGNYLPAWMLNDDNGERNGRD